jgi:chromosome segregation ATPase
MNSGTAATAIEGKVINNPECVNRILTIVQRLQQESKDRDSDFQSRIKQAVSETQERVEEQYRTELERAVSEAKEETRKEATRTLLNRFHLEISKLQADFDRRLQDVVAEAEGLERLKIDSAVAIAKEAVRQQVLEEAKNEYQPKLSEMESLVAQLKEARTSAASESRTEKEQLQERIATLERERDAAGAERTEKLDGYKELERKLEEALQSKAQLQMDLQQAVSELKSQRQPSAKGESDPARQGEISAVVHGEMIRVRSHLDEIEKTLANGTLELGSEIRLARERGELHAYLKGLRYSLGEVTLQSSTMERPAHA